MPQEIQLFAGRQIRTYWDDTEEKYYFCIIDSIEALTDSKDPAGYFKKLRQRDSELDSFVRGTNCPPHQFISSDGKRHSPKCIDVQGLFRIIQSIPSKKAEPFKRWLAQVGADRIHQMQDPELGIQQSLADFKRLGYSDNWINQRLKSIENPIIHTEDDDYYIDLVFYNYLLKCFVLIDLKTTRISYEDVGQMDMYLQMYDDHKRSEGDNLTIGIILCADTNADVARYSSLAKNKQLYASKYLTYMPSTEELRQEVERQKEIYRLSRPDDSPELMSD